MKYYMAPMEGLTGYIYRNAYQKYFHDIDRWMSWTVFLIKFSMHVTAKSPSKPESEKIRRTSGRISLRFMRNIRYRS